jgi:hypothetical protein
MARNSHCGAAAQHVRGTFFGAAGQINYKIRKTIPDAWQAEEDASTPDHEIRAACGW